MSEAGGVSAEEEVDCLSGGDGKEGEMRDDDRVSRL